MTIESLVEEGRLLFAPCPFCGATPHRGPGKMQSCQLHGEPLQDFSIWCPHSCAWITRPNEQMAIAAWNTRVPANTPPSPDAKALRAEIINSPEDVGPGIEEAGEIAYATADAILALIASRGGGVPDGWKPIETAPKDGSRIDVWAFWPKHSRSKRTPDAYWNGRNWQLGQYDETQYVHRPQITHWMAVPAIPNPPASEQPSRADTDRAIQIGRELDAEDGGYPLPEQFAENAKCSEQATIPAPDVSHLRQKAGD